jgi:hypothetical protein
MAELPVTQQPQGQTSDLAMQPLGASQNGEYIFIIYQSWNSQSNPIDWKSNR